MRKLALLSAAALSLGTIATVSAPAEARPGYRGGYAYGYHGRPYAHGYGYRGRRGISTGAAVGLGIAGLAAGAIAADAARRNGYYYGAPAYRAPAYGYYDYDY